LRASDQPRFTVRAETERMAAVEMRLFGGLDDADIAAALGVNKRTVKRDWSMAKALLCASLGKTNE